MKKSTVIGLLSALANGMKPPKIVIHRDDLYEYCKVGIGDKTYVCKTANNTLGLFNNYALEHILNDTVYYSEGK